MLTERWGVVFGEHLILGSVRVEEQEVIEIADAVGQRANGEVFGCVGHEVPNHSLTWRHTAHTQRSISCESNATSYSPGHFQHYYSVVLMDLSFSIVISCVMLKVYPHLSRLSLPTSCLFLFS